MTIRLITFDLDETLWDTPTILSKAEDTMLAWLHADVPSFASVYAERKDRVRSAILKDRPQIQYDFNKIRVAVVETVLRECGLGHAEANELAQAALCIFHGERNVFEPYKGAELLLRSLGEKYVLASLSNGTSEVNRTRLGKYFELSIYAADAGVRKPDPVLFQMIFNHVKIPAEQSLHVGDHPIEDIEIAAKLGMSTVQLVHPNCERSVFADKVVTELAEVYSAIEALTRKRRSEHSV